MYELDTTREEYKVLPPSEFLEGLVVNMRLFEELKAQRDAMAATIAASSELFGELDIEVQTVPQQPVELAFRALEYVISKKKIGALEEDMRELVRSGIFTEMNMRLGGLYKRQYEIMSLDPSHEIGAFYASDYSNQLLNYAGKSYQKRKGRVDYLSLNPATGGFINIVGRGGRIYQAASLIVSENDYQPVFEIKDLSE